MTTYVIVVGDVFGHFLDLPPFVLTTPEAALRSAVVAPLFGWYRAFERAQRNAWQCRSGHGRLACGAADLRAGRRRRKRLVWRLAARSA